jgi:radical SAM protein with 4Fe4S-binding SPASM domain
MKRVRYESFGGLIRIEDLPATIYVDKDYMKNLGYKGSELWNQKSTHLSAPIDVHFALTNRCPLECKHCYKSSSTDFAGDLSLTQIKNIINVLSEMKIFSVAFGGGEPFARKDIFEIAEYTRNNGIIPNVTTNGFYITEKNAEKCKIFGHMHVSLDLPNKDFDKLKNVGAFQAAVRAIDLLNQQKMHIGINCVISRSNFDDLEELVKFSLSKNIKDISFLRFKPIGRADKQYLKMKLTNEQNIKLFPLLKKLTKKYKIISQVDCSMTPLMCYHKPNLKIMDFYGAQGCEGGNLFIEIKEDASIRACSFSNFYGNSALKLKQIWDQSEYLTKYRDVINSLEEPCLSCKYSEICRGGCHVISEFLTGDFTKPDPECPTVVAYNRKK